MSVWLCAVIALYREKYAAVSIPCEVQHDLDRMYVKEAACDNHNLISSNFCSTYTQYLTVCTNKQHNVLSGHISLFPAHFGHQEVVVVRAIEVHVRLLRHCRYALQLPLAAVLFASHRGGYLTQ